MLNTEEKGHLLGTAHELGLVVVAYSPLSCGLLTEQAASIP